MKEGGKIVLNEGILTFYSANPSFAEFLTKYYTKKPNWLL
jgi:hypothetical protein